MRAACDAAGLALVPLVAPTTPDDRLDGDRRAARAASSTRCRSRARRASARRCRTRSPPSWRGRRRTRTVPVALGFGIATPEHAAQAADAGADGVIVGSRLVRAAGESEDPAGAVREVVAGMADALR